MSDTSLLTGVYANVEAYATLIDNVIERLRTTGSNPANPEQSKLGQILIDASDQGHSSQSLEALVFDSLLRSETGECRIDLRQLGQRLLSQNTDKNLLKQLELLAKALERERADVASRLRGR
jgi:hypothetical protein